MTISIISFLFLCIALSTDTFTAGLSYGAGRVRVSPLSAAILSLLSGLLFTLSLLAGQRLAGLFPARLAELFSFAVLFLLGLYKLYDALPERFHRRSSLTTASFSEKVNKKDVQTLSGGEAALLSLVLSVDSVTAGISSRAPELSPVIILLISALIQFFSMQLGLQAGKIFLGRSSANSSRLSCTAFSCTLLFALAFSRIL